MSGNVVAALPLEMPRGLNKAKLVLWYQMLSATFEYEARWHLMALDQNTWAEKETLSMDYIS